MGARTARIPPRVLAGVVALALLAALAAGCGGSRVAAVSAPSCGPLEFGGEGEPDVVIASDLPLTGADGTVNRQIVEAVRLVLERSGWRAGERSVAFQSCDDSTEAEGGWDPQACARNAEAYASAPDLWGVIGTYNSGCAALEIPVLNEAEDGPVAMVSPANTWLCLTVAAPACDEQEPGSPGKWYPGGERTFVRVAVDDSWQAAAQAMNAGSLGVERAFVLYSETAYGIGLAESFRAAAERLGIEVVGYEPWDAGAADYRDVFERVRESGADGVFLSGPLSANGAQLLKDKVAVLGPNDGPVRVMVASAFVLQNLIDLAGEAARGAYGSNEGLPVEQFPPEGQEFVAALRKLVGGPVDPYAIHGAEAAQVLLAGIAAARDRGDVAARLRESRFETISGPVELDANGDPLSRAITIYEAAETFTPVRTIVPPADLVAAARGL